MRPSRPSSAAMLALLAGALSGFGPGSQLGQVNALQASDARAEAGTGGKGALPFTHAGAAAERRSWVGSGYGAGKPPRYPSREGWTNARYRRAAAKRRRVAANRRAHRG